MPLYEWAESSNIDGEIIVAQGARQLNGTIPPDVVYVPAGPSQNVTLSGIGLTYAETVADQAKWGTLATFTDKNSNSITGWVAGVSRSTINGSVHYNETITLKIPYMGV